MIINMKDLLYQWFMRRLYLRDTSLYFPVFSDAPKYLNFAYPDFSVQYFVTTFRPGTVTMTGTIPKTGLEFFSISVYGTNGLPVYAKCDVDLCPDESFVYHETLHFKTVSALIVRFYRKNPKESFEKFLPIFSLEKTRVSNSMRISMSEKLESCLLPRIVKQNKNILHVLGQRTEFFKPSNKMLKSLFPNPFAYYLIAIPQSPYGWIDIHAPPFSKEDYRFVGFMASNYSTTETDDSIRLPTGNKKYRVWFGYGPRKRNMKYYLQWKKTNHFPILVYREVRLQKKGLANYKSQVDPKQLRKIMHYPEITYSN